MDENIGADFRRQKAESRGAFFAYYSFAGKVSIKIYEYSHPTSYAQLCDMLTQRFSDKHARFHKFSQLVALRQGPGGLDKYMEKFLELQTQVPNMSALDALDIYFGGLDFMARIHL